MSQTLKLSASMRLVDSDTKLDNVFLLIPQKLINRTTAIMASGVQAIGTTEETLDFGNVSTPHWAAFLNLDAQNDIEVGFTVSAVFYGALEIPAGEFALVPLDPDRTWQAKADTAESNLQYVVFQRNA